MLVRVCCVVVALVLLSSLPSHAAPAIQNLPSLVAAEPKYVQVKADADLLLDFEEEKMNDATSALLSLRGAGFWDEEVECNHVTSTQMRCVMPSFVVAGQVAVRVQFNSTTNPSPFLPLGHDLVVWDLTMKEVSPTVISRLADTRKVTVACRGLFQNAEKDNLVVRVGQGSDATIMSLNKTNVESSFRLSLLLPRLARGSYSVSVSVNGGRTFVTSSNTFSVYEPLFDTDRLSVTPMGGPLTGGTPLTIHGVYGLILTPTMRIKFSATEFVVRTDVFGNQTTTLENVEVTAPVTTNDKLPYQLVDKPTLHLVTPRTLTPGYYRLSFADREGAGYTTIPALQFTYYDFNVTAMAPISGSVSEPPAAINLFAPSFPHTGTFVLRYGQSVRNPTGSFVYNHDVVCDEHDGTLQNLPLTTGPQAYEMVRCPLPDLTAFPPSHGLTLTLKASANGVDFNLPLPFNEFVFHGAKATTMTPTQVPSLCATNITIGGHGFISVPNTNVLLVATTTTQTERVVEARFGGEGFMHFTAPPLFDFGGVSGRVVVKCFLLFGGDDSSRIPLPDLVYDTTTPEVTSIVVDSGNALSANTASNRDTITIRLTATTPIQNIEITSLTIGNYNRSAFAVVKPINADFQNTSTVWSVTYCVQQGDDGVVGFAFRLSNPIGNFMDVSTSSSAALISRTVTVASAPPRVVSCAFRGADLSEPSVATPGSTAVILVTANTQLHQVSVNNITIGDQILNINDTPCQTVGNYPSTTWNILIPIPVDTAGGPIHFDLKLVGTDGNLIENFTDLESVVGSFVSVPAALPEGFADAVAAAEGQQTEEDNSEQQQEQQQDEQGEQEQQDSNDDQQVTQVMTQNEQNVDSVQGALVPQ